MPRSGDGGPRRRTGLSRRSFLVLAGGLTLGRFPLPPPAAQPTARARRLVGPPTRRGDGDRNLPWTERTDSGDVETMMYHLLDVQNFVARERIRMMEMEWIDGYDLGRLLTPRDAPAGARAGERRALGLPQQRDRHGRARSQPRLKPGIAIAVLRDCLAALSALHREGIVHGDVKPSNIMLKRTGNAKIIDIGSAFAREDARPARRPTPRPRSWRGRWARNDRADAGKASFDRIPWGDSPPDLDASKYRVVLRHAAEVALARRLDRRASRALPAVPPR